MQFVISIDFTASIKKELQMFVCGDLLIHLQSWLRKENCWNYHVLYQIQHF